MQRLQLKFNMSPSIWNLGKNILASRQIFKSYIEKPKLRSLTQIENKIQENKEIVDNVEPLILAQPKTKIYECHYKGCGKSFQTSWNLKRHINEVHLQLRPFKCDVCGDRFKRQFHLDRHKAAKHAEHLKIVKCPYCHETFKNFKELEVHVGQFHRVTDHQCPRCKKYLSTKWSLNRHIDRCLGIKIFKCPECKKAFFLKNELENHMKHNHSNDRNYVCDVEDCEERPHQCPYCEKAYKSLQSLLTHVYSKHPKGDDNENNSKGK